MNKSENEILVKIRFESKVPEDTLSKKLFGYREWRTKHGKKEYRHKPIVGALQNVPLRRVGRGTFVLPELYVQEASSTIEANGGRVKSVSPVALDFEESAQLTRSIFSSYLRGVIGSLEVAHRTRDEKLVHAALARALLQTKTFAAFLKQIDDYGLDSDSDILRRRLVSLVKLAQTDLEGARAQAGVLTEELERFKNSEF
jgi:hypothetical protein